MSKITSIADEALNTNEASRAAAEANIESLKSDIADLRTDFKKLFSNAATFVHSTSEQSLEKGVEKGQEATEHVRAKFGEVKETSQDKIRKHPIASVGLALGVGALIAVLSRK